MTWQEESKRKVVLAYQNGDITRGGAIVALRNAGWSRDQAERMLDAIDRNVRRPA